MNVREFINACINDFSILIIEDNYDEQKEEYTDVRQYTGLSDVPAEIRERKVEYFYLDVDNENNVLIIDLESR